MAPGDVIDKTEQTDPRVHGGSMGYYDPDGMVLHHTGSYDEGGDEYWLTTYHSNPVSTNQLVHRDGTILQLVAQDVIAWHAGTSSLNGRSSCNAWCIGIEICNAGDGERFTDEQYEAVALTVAYNCARFFIQDKDISSHKRVAAAAGRNDKYDPYGWDWSRMWTRVDQLRSSWPWSDVAPWWDNTSGSRVMST